MKLFFYAFSISLTIANIAYGMENRTPSPITLEELLEKEENASNTLTSEEVSRLTLHAQNLTSAFDWTIPYIFRGSPERMSPVRLEKLENTPTAPLSHDIQKKANTLTSQEVSRLTLYAIAEKRLVGTKK